MSDYYLGGIGKDFSWQLVSDFPFVVFVEETNEFTGVPTLKEALEYLDSATHTAYAFSPWAVTWQKIDFAAEGKEPSKPAIGFTTD